MVKYTKDRIIDMIADEYDGRKIYVLTPLVKNRKGHYKELFENLRKKVTSMFGLTVNLKNLPLE